MATTIQTADVLDFNAFPNPQSVRPGAKIPNPGEFMTRYHPKVGTLKFKSLIFSHMHVMNLHWKAVEHVRMCDQTPTSTININFHMAGNLNTVFDGISHALNMKPGRHNLVFSPDGGEVNEVAAGDSLEMFHISLDKGFFSDVIGCDDRWSEKVQENLLHGRAFSGFTGTLGVTPSMQYLIREIKQCEVSGAMRNLFVQSKVLELLALQIDQFRGQGDVVHRIPHSDAERLYQLKEFLDARFLEEFSLAQLARICLLNEFKIKKGFRELFGTTVFGYLRKLRMDYAERLLLDSSCTVEDVSDVLGYEHAQHFSTAFKKFRGISPSAIKSGRNLTNMLK